MGNQVYVIGWGRGTRNDNGTVSIDGKPGAPKYYGAESIVPLLPMDMDPIPVAYMGMIVCGQLESSHRTFAGLHFVDAPGTFWRGCKREDINPETDDWLVCGANWWQTPNGATGVERGYLVSINGTIKSNGWYKYFGATPSAIFGSGGGNSFEYFRRVPVED